MASIRFENVVKVYPGVKKPVIPNLNLEIKDKEFIILVGPSGCGKSTTLRMIAGLEDITSGKLYIDSNVVNDVAPAHRDIAMVFQSYALYPNMTVYKNIAFPLKVRKFTSKEIEGRVNKAIKEAKDKKLNEQDTKQYVNKVRHQKKLSKEEIDEKVHYVSKILDLDPYLNRKPKALSGGQRQRVALGRAMVRNPKVFLLDEPLSNLDAKLRTEMRSQISELHKKLDTTFVYVTHDQTEAMTIADKIAVLNLGVVQQFDTPRNLYERPTNLFVAGFIGSPEMNFITTKVVEENKTLYLLLDEHKIKLTLDAADLKTLRQYVEKDIIFGIRPEAITLAKHNEQGNENIFKIHVDQSEFLGSEIYLYFKINGNKIVARIPASYRVSSGMDLALSLNPRKFYFFDPESKETIVFSEINKDIPLSFK